MSEGLIEANKYNENTFCGMNEGRFLIKDDNLIYHMCSDGRVIWYTSIRISATQSWSPQFGMNIILSEWSTIRVGDISNE
jgi:hypothetical protein